MDNLEKQYNWLTIVLVIGIVLGSGMWIMKNSALFANNRLLPIGGCCGNNSSSVQPANSNTRGCGINPGGGCGNGGRGAAVNLQRVQVEALAFYRANYSENQVTVKVTDFGCHIQADIFEDDQLVKSLGYNGPGEFYEIF